MLRRRAEFCGAFYGGGLIFNFRAARLPSEKIERPKKTLGTEADLGKVVRERGSARQATGLGLACFFHWGLGKGFVFYGIFQS